MKKKTNFIGCLVVKLYSDGSGHIEENNSETIIFSFLSTKELEKKLTTSTSINKKI